MNYSNKSNIVFKIKVHSIEEQIFQINLHISNVKENGIVKLYKNKLNWFDIKCNSSLKDINNFVYIDVQSINFLDISYKVKVGTFEKHGQCGYISDDFITFSGEQVFIFPVEVLTISDINSSNSIENISIEYCFNKKLQAIIPFKTTNDYNILEKQHYSICNNPMWADIYEIMKSCYAFGDFNYIQYKNKNGNLNIFFEKDVKDFYNTKIFNEIEKINNYYQNLFKINKSNIDIVLFKNISGKESKIYGGSGRKVIGATFNLNNSLRDWQLLSHRLFHSFMDFKIPISDFHMPPNLWITEGLATYYENMALECLSNDLKNQLGIKFFKDKKGIVASNEFNKLFKRYLYLKFKDKDKFSLIPMEEGIIKSLGKLEFLHYTQCPILIKFIEDTVSLINGKKNNIIDYIINLNEYKNFSIKEMIYHLFGEKKGDEFALKFLFSDELIPLWYLEDKESVKDVVDDLNKIEYIIWTWLSMECDYRRIELSEEKFKSYSDNNNFNFSSLDIEEKIRSFSPILYMILKNLESIKKNLY